jgi:hypothetical protein
MSRFIEVYGLVGGEFTATTLKGRHRLSFLEYECEDMSAVAFWVKFVETIGVSSDGLPYGVNAVKCGPGRFVIAVRKDDQRAVVLPSGCKRKYVVPAPKTSRVRHDMVRIYKDLNLVGGEQVRSIHVQCITEGDANAFDVFSTLKEMDPTARNFLRLQASMVPAKKRTPLQTAVVSAWSTIEGLIQEGKDDEVYRHDITSPDWPTLGSYGAVPFSYSDLDDRLECKFYNPVTNDMEVVSFKRVMEDLVFERSLVISGERYIGKTQFAGAVAKEVALMHADDEVDPTTVFFHFMSSIQILERCKDLHTSGCLVFDDLDLGSTMFWNASPAEFLKAAVDTERPGALRLLGKYVFLPAVPKIFTTNESDLNGFLRLRNQESIAQSHFEAVARRLVWIRVTKQLYSVEQQEVQQNAAALSRVMKVARIAAMRAAGTWK